MPGERVKQRQPFHFFVEQLHPQGDVFGFRRKNIDDLAAHTKGAARKRLVVAGVLQLRQPPQDGALVDQHALRQMQHHLQIQVRIAQTVNGGHRRHHHHVAPFQQRFGGGQPHLFDVFVDRGVLLDEGVRTRHIGFGLVVVVVRNEILHRILRKKRFHFAIQLRRQRLVGRQHHGRPVKVGDHIGDGERFTGPRDPQ